MPKKNNKTILVTGATGHQGGAVIRHLRERGFAVRALTRNPDKPEARELGPGTEIVRGDLSDASSITRALEDVAGVYSVQDSTQGFDTEVRQGTNVADAVNRSAVGHLVYSSVASADRNTQIPHFDSKAKIEDHIRNTGVRYTIFRPVFFMENLLQMKDMIEHGTFAMPLSPDTRLQMIAVDDIGAFATMAFEHPGKWAGKVMELAGDELSMTEIADHLSRITGQTVKYSQVDWKDFEGRAGKEIATMFRWFESDGYHIDIASVRGERAQLLSFDRWLDVTWRKAPATQKAGSEPS
jgi:uncharacterized protein YbjT (DUF2867 family)